MFACRRIPRLVPRCAHAATQQSAFLTGRGNRSSRCCWRCRRNWTGHPISQTVFSKFESAHPVLILNSARRTRLTDDSRRGYAGDATRKLHARMRPITHVDQRLTPLRNSEIAEFLPQFDRRILFFSHRVNLPQGFKAKLCQSARTLILTPDTFSSLWSSLEYVYFKIFNTSAFLPLIV